MPIPADILAQLIKKTYTTTQLDLSGKALTNSDITTLLPLLNNNPQITGLNLSNNPELTNACIPGLAQNTTLLTLKIKHQNPNISLRDLSPFMKNTTLQSLPFQGGSGDDLQKLRAHIKKNRTRTKTQFVPKKVTITLPARPKVLQRHIKQLPAIEEIEDTPKPIETQSVATVNPPAQADETAHYPTELHCQAFQKPAKAGYLTRAVGKKQKTGQQNLNAIWQALLFDLEDFQDDITFVTWYTAIALNFAMHNASHRPLPGYGKVAFNEAHHHLYYYRSQKNHPHACQFHRTIKTTTKTKKSYLPRNESYERILKGTAIFSGAASGFSHLDKDGFETKKLTDNFASFLIYSGARANNLSVLYRAVESQISTKNDLTAFLKTQLNPKQKYKVLPVETKAVEHISKLRQAFDQLATVTRKPLPIHDLSTTLYANRQNAAQRLLMDLNIKSLTNMQFSTQGSNLFIELYPGFINDSKNYMEGVSNVILNFFSGLINHKAKQKGLYFRVDRRQSFAFLRSTLSDCSSGGKMRIRLSLGLESNHFLPLIQESLEDLHELLNIYDFRNKEHEKLKNCFEVCEKSKARDKKATEKTGVRMLKTMRHHEKRWRLQYVAQEKLTEHADNPSSAFADYLQAIVAESDKTYSSSQTAVKQAPEQFRQDLYTDDASPVAHDYQHQHSLLFNLLDNTLFYVINYIRTFPIINDTTPFKQSIYHCMNKLLRNSDKASALINSIGTYESSHLQTKATLLIEGMLEYLIMLDGIKTHIIEKDQHHTNYIDQLKQREKNLACKRLGVNESLTDIYFTDNGQQAICNSFMMMDAYVKNKPTLPGKAKDKKIYLFDDSYFEISGFLEKVGELRSYDKSQSATLFIDITKITSLRLAEFTTLEACIIDVTHQPDLNHPELKELIQMLHRQNILVTLVQSALKHKQLGLDKYQSGQIMILPPNAEAKPTLDVQNQLENVSKEAMPTDIARYLTMVHDICDIQTHAVVTKTIQPSPSTVTSTSGIFALRTTPATEVPALSTSLVSMSYDRKIGTA